jgi:quinol monooxygenase YgiN
MGTLSESKRGTEMIHVIAILTTKPGKREEVLANIRAGLSRVHAEPGCIEYAVASDAEIDPRYAAARTPGLNSPVGPDTLVFVEKWESLDALDAHIAALPSAPSTIKNRDLVAGRVVHILSPG